MKVYTNSNSSFPSQVVSDEEKASLDYGLQVARAIEGEWFQEGRSGNRYAQSYSNFHQLRLYARGEQSIAKYKDELSINGDLSYLNLDWKPVPIIPKFVDIVVNGMSNKEYDIIAYAQDPESQKKRTDHANAIAADMVSQDLIEEAKATTGQDFSRSNIPPSELPSTLEELELHMQLSYKQGIEVAEEEVINNTLARNKYNLTRRRLNYDLAVLGIAAVKTTFNVANGINIEYVDPAYMVYSYTEDPNFDDIYYVGEVKSITIPELKKQLPIVTGKHILYLYH